MSAIGPRVMASVPMVGVAEVEASPEYFRLPRQGEHDPLFGLTRSYLNLLILPCKLNNFHPQVRSSVLRQGNAKSGVRLVNVVSLRAYLRQQIQGEEGLSVGSCSRAEANEPVPPPSRAEFIRLPKPKRRDPLFGLSRSFLNELILPCPANGFRPPVQSHVLRRRGSRNGIRLISVDSLRHYIELHEETGAGPAAAAQGEPRIEQGDI